jgi:hypothetical protein
LYANALLSAYDVKRSTSSASLGLTAIGSVSLPIGQSADSMVKTAEETITDREFYRRFFAAVDAAIAELQPEPATPDGLADMGRGTMSGSRKSAPEGRPSGNPKDPSMQAATQPEPGKASQSPDPSTPAPTPHGQTPAPQHVQSVMPLASQPAEHDPGLQGASEPAMASPPAISAAPADPNVLKPADASPSVLPATSTAASRTPAQGARSTAGLPPPASDTPSGTASAPTP